MDYAIASDLGATNLRVGLVSMKGQLEQKIELETPQDNPDEVINLIVNAVSRLDIKNKAVSGIGVGIGGLVDFNNGKVLYAPNFTFENIYLKEILSSKFKLPVFIDNDANTAALGEKVFGSGKNIDNMVLLTLGSGIGGGIIIDGQIYRGSSGVAGEIGHMIIQIGGPKCMCGNEGDLESLASGRALDREARKAVRNSKDSLMFKLADGNIERINGVLVTKAALQGDELANKLITQHAEKLAVGLANVVNIFDPELIVLSGGMSETGNLLLSPAKKALKNLIFADIKNVTKIVFGDLGPEAGILGAAALVFKQLEEQ
ncbi:hypothetical protein LCGC14_1028320 [marine sediment metagenome]|uniref:Glucokinase n=1 Tax=marine sediment metagenome TaxID=412755 RepID=A0A0F9MVC9_9ZZZZ